MGSENIIFEWYEPKEQRREAFKTIYKLHIKLFPQIAVLATLVIYGIYLLVKDLPLPDEHPSWERLFTRAYLGCLALIILMFFLAPLQSLTKTKYQLTERGIKVISSRLRYLKWENLKAYNIDETKPNIIYLTTLSNKNKVNSIFIPKEKLCEIIERIPEGLAQFDFNKWREEQRLPSGINMYLFIFSAIFATLLAYFCALYYFTRINLIIVLILILIFGPGTIGALIVFRKRFFKDASIRALARCFNLFAVILFLAMAAIFSVRKYFGD
jgi:hypothetical protein